MAEVAKGIIDIEINTGSAASQLQALQTQINAFNLALNKSNKAQGTFAAEYSRELQGAINKTGLFTAETVRLSTAASTLDKTLSKGKTSLGQFFSAKFNRDSAIAAETMALAAERAKRLQTQFIATSGAANGFQEALAVRPLAAFSSEAAVAAQRTQLLSNMFKQGTTQLINFGKNVQWAGRQLMVGFTVPLTIFGALAGKTFMDLEKQMVSFRKVYGDINTTIADTDKNLEAIKGLASEYTKYGIAVKDTIGLAAQAAAAGRQNADLTDAVSQATRLATLGQMEQNAALETTISLQSAFRLSGQDLADTINFLNMVENQTVVSLQDIAAAIPRVAPVIAGLGGDVKDLTVFLAAMQEGGVDAAEGANALKSGLASLINPTKQATEMLSGMGINLDAIIQANKGDLMGTVQSFAQALASLDQFSRQQALEQVFGKFQYAKLGALFDNISRKGSQAQQVIATMGYTTEQLGASADKELKVIEESFGVQLTGAVERFKLAIAPIGEIFVKLAIPIVNFVTKIVEGFNGLSEGQKKFAAIGAVIVGVVIPALTMMAGLFLNLVGTLAKMSQGMALFTKGFITGGPAGAFKALTQSSKYLSLAEMDAAMAAQQLSGASQILNTTLIEQVGTANAAAAAIANLTKAYSAMIATQGAASGLPSFGVAGAAGTAAKTSAVRIRGIRRNAGGGVPGVGNTDTVPAMLTPGEFVVNKEATKENLGLLKAINGGQKLNAGGKVQGMQYFENGGLVLKLVDFINNGTAKLDDIMNSPSYDADTKNKVARHFGLSQAMQTSSVGASLKPNATTLLPGRSIIPSSAFSSIILGSKSLDDMITRLGLSIFGIPESFNKSLATSGAGLPVSELIKYLEDAGPETFETLNDALDQIGDSRKLDTNSIHGKIIDKLKEIQAKNPNQKIKDIAKVTSKEQFLGFQDLVDSVLNENDKAILETLRSEKSGSGRLVSKRGKDKFESDMRVAQELKKGLVARGVIPEGTELLTRRVKQEAKGSKPIIEIYDKDGNIYQRYNYGNTLVDTQKVSYSSLKFKDTFKKIAENLIVSKSKFAGLKTVRAHLNSGGVVPGSGNTDTVPAMLTPGEFVINKKAASQNQQLLEMINGGEVKGYNKGGMIASGVGTVGQMAGMATGNTPLMVAGTVLQLLGPSILKAVKDVDGMGSTFKKVATVGGRLSLGMTSVVGGLALAGFAIYKLNKEIKTAERSGAEFSKAMYGTSKSVEGIAQAFGRETLAASARRASTEKVIGGVSAEAQQQSSEFMQGDAGKKLLQDIELVKKEGGIAVDALKNQLASAIVAGAITQEEAKAIATDIGIALNDRNIAISVTGQLKGLMGPDGKDLIKNISSITVDISPKIDKSALLQEAESAYEDLSGLAAIFTDRNSFIQRSVLNSISEKNSESYSKEAQARELLNAAYQQGSITLDELVKKQEELRIVSQNQQKESDKAKAAALGYNSMQEAAAAANKLVPAGRGGMVSSDPKAKAAIDESKNLVKKMFEEELEYSDKATTQMMKDLEKLSKVDMGIFTDLLNGNVDPINIPILTRLSGDLDQEGIDKLEEKLLILENLPNIEAVIDFQTAGVEEINAAYQLYLDVESLDTLEKKVTFLYGESGLDMTKDQYNQFAALPDLQQKMFITEYVTRKTEIDTKIAVEVNEKGGKASLARIGALNKEAQKLFAEIMKPIEQTVSSTSPTIGDPKVSGDGKKKKNLVKDWFAEARKNLKDIKDYKRLMDGAADATNVEALKMIPQEVYLKMTNDQREKAIVLMQKQIEQQNRLNAIMVLAETQKAANDVSNYAKALVTLGISVTSDIAGMVDQKAFLSMTTKERLDYVAALEKQKDAQDKVNAATELADAQKATESLKMYGAVLNSLGLAITSDIEGMIDQEKFLNMTTEQRREYIATLREQDAAQRKLNATLEVSDAKKAATDLRVYSAVLDSLGLAITSDIAGMIDQGKFLDMTAAQRRDYIQSLKEQDAAQQRLNATTGLADAKQATADLKTYVAVLNTLGLTINSDIAGMIDQQKFLNMTEAERREYIATLREQAAAQDRLNATLAVTDAKEATADLRNYSRALATLGISVTSDIAGMIDQEKFLNMTAAQRREYIATLMQQDAIQKKLNATLAVADARQAAKNLQGYANVLKSLGTVVDSDIAGMIDQQAILHMSAKERIAYIASLKDQLNVQRAIDFLTKSSSERTLESLDLASSAINMQNSTLNTRLEGMQRENELLQRQVAIRNRSLDLLGKEEEKINKLYDDRIDALDKVAKANDRISEQDRSRVDLASALASGNIAAAANAASTIQQQEAQYRIEDSRTALEAKRQKELESLTVSVNGVLMTRKQIQEQISQFSEKIYKSEQDMQAVQDTLYANSLKQATLDDQRMKLEQKILLTKMKQNIEALRAQNLTGQALKDFQDYIDAYNSAEKAASDIGVGTPGQASNTTLGAGGGGGAADNVSAPVVVPPVTPEPSFTTKPKPPDATIVPIRDTKDIKPGVVKTPVVSAEDQALADANKKKIADQIAAAKKAEEEARARKIADEIAAAKAAAERAAAAEAARRKAEQEENARKAAEAAAAKKAAEIAAMTAATYTKAQFKAGILDKNVSYGKEQYHIAKQLGYSDSKAKTVKADDMEEIYIKKSLEERFAITKLVKAAQQSSKDAFYTGGKIPGIGGMDSIKITATPGEFMVRKPMVKKYGLPMLEAINSGAFKMPKISEPTFGIGKPDRYRIPESGKAQGPETMYNNTYNVNVNVSGTNASPDDIANVVMAKLSQQDRGNLRSSKY
jgi:hypothetical protein